MLKAIFVIILVPLCGCNLGGKSGCDPGFTNCAGMCVDLTGDKYDCGACRNQCLDSEFCSNGKCTITCTTGEVDCNGQCVNLSKDGNNCGTCGTTCFAGKTCLAGVCQTPPSVLTVDPDNGTSAPASTTITITFSESVTATATAFTLGCPLGSAVATTADPSLPGSGTIFTLTPGAALHAGECTLTVTAAEVTDGNGLTLLRDINSSFDVSSR